MKMLPLLLVLTLMATWREAGGVGVSSLLLREKSATACGPCECSFGGQTVTVDCSSRQLTAVPQTSFLPATATTLLLNNNSISHLQPSALEHFVSLQTLDLSHNLLTEANPEAFKGLGKVWSLDLSQNQLTLDSISPSEMPFTFLTALRFLNLNHNLLSDMSRDWGLPKHSLQWMDLSHNRITNSSEYHTVNDLFNLTFLDLSHNQIQTIAGLFVGMNSLQKLDLRFNNIPLSEVAYPPTVFDPIRSTLFDLALEGNCRMVSINHSLSYPDQALSKLTHLRFLSMDGLPRANFRDGFRNMSSLNNLTLSGLAGGYCSMDSLSNNTFLSMPVSLLQLNLSGCDIVHIEADAFRPLRKIEVLDLSLNMDLGFDTLGDAFYSLQGSELRLLHINSIIRPYSTCVMVTPHNTRYFRNTSLQSIHAQNNRLEILCEGALNNMPDTLRFVSVDENNFGFGSYFKDLGSLKNVVDIHNDGHRHSFEPPTEYPSDHMQQCKASHSTSGSLDSHSPCQRLWRLDDYAEVWTPQLEGYPRSVTSSHDQKLVFTLPPHLHIYVSRWNKLYYRLINVHFNPNNSLTTLDLSNNLLTQWIGPITGLNKLVLLDLANNMANNASYTFFDTLASLKSLNASRNNLRSVIRYDEEGRLFQHLNQLEHLYLSKNYINHIPQKMFQSLVKLQTLDMSMNAIFIFDANITMMENISLLDLSYNYIAVLPQFIMDHLDHVAAASGHDVYVNLTSNPISCTCEQISFLTWIQTSKVLFPEGYNYSCRMSDGSVQRFIDIFNVIKDLQGSCTDKSGILVGAVSCFICMMMVLGAALIYRYRWKLRYLYYASRLFYSLVDNTENDDFVYDAFVSYSSENNDFVHGVLQEELETRADLRLNIHNRDFTPGRLIPSNIVDAVQKSRHTLVVLTRDLLESDWCHYEMQMAMMEASYTGRDVLIFLLYEDVPSHELPRDVFYNLQASTYISFPSQAEPSQIREFWARLVQALKR